MKTVGMAVVGCGSWGANHCRTYVEHVHSDLIAVCDLDGARSAEFGSTFGVDHYTDIQEMLNDERIDAVAVVTPDFAHAEPLVAAVEAGKHVIVEKPLVTTREDAARVVAAAGGSDVKIMADFHNRWSPVYFKIWEDIQEGKLGRPISAYFRLNDVIGVPLDGFIAWPERTSILWFLGSHSVDVLCWLFDSKVRRVYAVSRSEVLHGRGLDVPDLYQSILEFENGGVATMENGWITPNSNGYINDHKFNITGEKGMFNVDFSNNSLLQRFLEDKSDQPDILVRPVIQGRPTGLAFDSMRDFVDSVCFDREMKVSLASSVHVSCVILAIMESAQNREPVLVRNVEV